MSPETVLSSASISLLPNSDAEIFSYLSRQETLFYGDYVDRNSGIIDSHSVFIKNT